MKSKRVITLVVSLCLVVLLGIGATLAYYTSATDKKVNTFTLGNVDVDLIEGDWDPESGLNLQPGAEVPKKPYITNVGAGDGFVMLKVSGMNEMSAQGFSAVYDKTNWTLVKEDGTPIAKNDNVLVDGYYAYNSVLKSGDSTEPLFASVKLGDVAESAATTYKVIANYQDKNKGNELYTYKDINGNIITANKDRKPVVDAAGKPILKYTINGVAGKVFNSYEEAQAYVLSEYGDKASLVFDLTVQGFAVQTEGFNLTTNGTYTWVATLVTLAK